MNNTLATICYGQTKLHYELLVMKRKSLEIAVHPDKRIVVKAPQTSTLEAIEEKMRKRARWIKRQLAYFNQFAPRTPDRQYVGGESHLYLGRKYRLKIEVTNKDQVFLKNGYFYVAATSSKPKHLQALMNTWYSQRAKMHLSKIFADCWDVFKKNDLKKPNLKLQKMDKRWGSLSTKGQLTLNFNLIHTPKDCIEYVVMHELCHLIYHNHSPEFYKLLDLTLPDWVRRKHKLEMALI